MGHLGWGQFSILIIGVGAVMLICFKRESHSLEIKWIVVIAPTRNSTLYLCLTQNRITIKFVNGFKDIWTNLTQNDKLDCN